MAHPAPGSRPSGFVWPSNWAGNGDWGVSNGSPDSNGGSGNGWDGKGCGGHGGQWSGGGGPAPTVTVTSHWLVYLILYNIEPKPTQTF